MLINSCGILIISLIIYQSFYKQLVVLLKKYWIGEEKIFGFIY